MRITKPFFEMSIRRQMKIIVFVLLVLFIGLCELVSISIRHLVYQNEDEHMQVTALRLRDQIELTYEKIGNFCINIGEDQAVQKLMQSDYSELSGTIGGATECLTRHKILEPMIEDISLVNTRIHYSEVYSAQELDEIRDLVNGVPFCWLGLREHGFAADSGKGAMGVYAGDVTVGAENLGTIVISVDVSDFFEEGKRNPTYFLADEEGVLFSFSQSEDDVEKAQRLWAEGKRAEYLETGGYYIRSYYFEKMGCYLVSALNLKKAGMGMTRTQLLIWGCVLEAVVFCLVFFFLITKGIVRPMHQFVGTIKQIRQSHQRGLKEEMNLKGCAEIMELGCEFSGMLDDIESLNRKILLGIGYLQQAVSGGKIYEAFEECIARAYQYFVCGEDKICGGLDEGRSKGWMNAIQEKSRANEKFFLQSEPYHVILKTSQEFNSYSNLKTKRSFL